MKSAYVGIVYRGHNPRYASDPLSGYGAKMSGGRFNPLGVDALYTSLSPETCLLELGHGFKALAPPKTVVAYSVSCDDIAYCDTSGRCGSFGTEYSDLSCPWLDMHLTGQDPPTWILARKLIADGFAGMLVQSFAHGAKKRDKNLILWKYSKDRPHQIIPYDPNGDLNPIV